jgi:hypothetical protein
VVFVALLLNIYVIFGTGGLLMKSEILLMKAKIKGLKTLRGGSFFRVLRYIK